MPIEFGTRVSTACLRMVRIRTPAYYEDKTLVIRAHGGVNECESRRAWLWAEEGAKRKRSKWSWIAQRRVRKSLESASRLSPDKARTQNAFLGRRPLLSFCWQLWQKSQPLGYSTLKARILRVALVTHASDEHTDRVIQWTTVTQLWVGNRACHTSGRWDGIVNITHAWPCLKRLPGRRESRPS